MQVLNLHSNRFHLTPVDLFVSEPFDFDQVYTNALEEEFENGSTFRIVDLETLLKMKRSAGRDKDLLDCAELSKIHGEISSKDNV